MGTTNQEYSYGSQGSGVSKLQELLNKAGFNLTVDGIFGKNTLSAVKKYQQDNGLAVDGIAGKNTLAALNGANNTTNKATTNTTPKTTNKNTGFTYDDYIESDVVKEAKDALDTQLSQKPGDYTSKWQTQLDDIYNKIMNREDFSYDFNSDALYQQYKDKYIQQGKMAMADTMGQASAMTGGYGNSYAQSVGQQAYNAQLQNLNDVIPELYQMAYDKYNREGEDLYNQYALTMEQDQTDYGRYRDSVADWMSERDYLAGRYDTEKNFDYGTYIDGRDLAYTDHTNAIANEQWKKEFEEAQRQFNANLKEEQRQFNLKNAPSSPVVGAVGSVVGSVTGVTDKDDNGNGTEPEYDYAYVEDLIQKGLAADKPKSESWISATLRDAWKAGFITEAEFTKLKNKYVSLTDHQYTTGSGGRYTR